MVVILPWNLVAGLCFTNKRQVIAIRGGGFRSFEGYKALAKMKNRNCRYKLITNKAKGHPKVAFCFVGGAGGI
jgi:hypothetical protein